MLWPGAANVAVSVVHVAKGKPNTPQLHLDGEAVPAINCRLRGKPERPDPVNLAANDHKSFVGSYVLGMGFTLTPAERDALIRKSKKNAERIFPYLGGEEVNTSPTQEFDRYVISFGTMSLEEAERWPDLIAIVREKVKPERDKNNRDNYRKLWWRFGELRPGLYAALAPLSRCLVTSAISKHRVFAFAPAEWVFSHNTYVFPTDQFSDFAVLQSRVHLPWAALLSSGLEERGGYRPSDCFETFPFPRDATLSPSSAVERAGKTLYERRAKYMVATEQGLTKTYNQLKDPLCTEPRVEELRRLHEAMDRAVLNAYGWGDVEVPPYGTPQTAETRRALERFEDEVIDRLFTLNAERAAEEHRGVARTSQKSGPGLAKSMPPSAIPAKRKAEASRASRDSESRLKPGVRRTSAPPSKAPPRRVANSRKH